MRKFLTGICCLLWVDNDSPEKVNGTITIEFFILNIRHSYNICELAKKGGACICIGKSWFQATFFKYILMY